MIGNQRDLLGRARREVRGLFADEGATDRAISWAREVLARDGIDASAQQLRAIRALRRAERGLSLVGARYLVNAVNGQQQGPGSSRRSSPLLE